jgi:hypothetical protein
MASIPWTPIGVLLTALGLMATAVIAANRQLNKGRLSRNRRRQAELVEAERRGMEKATGIDPSQLAVEVGMLKVAVQGREADAYGNGGVDGLSVRMHGVETGLGEVKSTLIGVSGKLDTLIQNGNGH